MPLPREERITYAEYLQLPDDGKRYEVIDGGLFVTPSPVSAHQRSSLWIIRFVATWAEDRKLGRFWAAPMDVILAEDMIVQPDLLFIREARIANLVAKHVHGSPDLVIEILSPGTASRDQVTKRQAYARYGIEEYWIIDLEARTVSVHVLEHEHYVLLGSAVGDRAIPSKVLAGLPARACDIFQA